MRQYDRPVNDPEASDKKLGFWRTDRLADLPGECRKQRERYPTLEDFMPEVVKFYDNPASGFAD